MFSGTDSSLNFSEIEASYLKSAIPVARSEVFHSMVMKAMLREATYRSTSNTNRELVDMCKEESIGVDSKPKCGGYLCGKCTTGLKPMSLEN